VVFAVTGDMALLPVFEARTALEAAGHRVRIVSAANPRRLYRPGDVAWDTVSEPDNAFMDDDHFNALFDGDVLIVSAAARPAARTDHAAHPRRPARRDGMETRRDHRSAGEIMAFNGLTARRWRAGAGAVGLIW